MQRACRRHFRGSVGRLVRAATVALALCTADSAHALMISEVLYNPVAFGSDDGLEFVELFNDEPVAVWLDDYSLGWGGADYTTGSLPLIGAGWIQPGEYVVIGGPSDPLGFDFAPDLEDGFFVADGVALFDSSGDPTPVDALIYGTVFAGNWNGLIDASGTAGPVMVTIGGAGQSAARDASGTWTASGTPSPGTGPMVVPELQTGVLLGTGLLMLGLGRRGRIATPR
jgi:hypothetical protein